MGIDSMTPDERKHMTWKIAKEVIPSISQKRSSYLLKSFRNLKYPLIDFKIVVKGVLENPVEFKSFCHNLFLFENKLPDNEFASILNKIDSLCPEQIEIMLNKVLLEKANILFLKNNKKGGHF